MKETIAVWFSCGVASAVAAKKTIELYGEDYNIRIINNIVIEEDPDNLRFLKDVEKWLGVKIETAINPKYPNCSAVEVWEKRKYMSGVAGAPCTGELKKKARQHWENNNDFSHLVMGFTAEEKGRRDRFLLSERDNLITPLIDLNLSKGDCFMIMQDVGISPPAIYKRGYPNANCIGCVKSASPTYWNLVRAKDPEVFKQRAEQSRRIGTKLVKVKGERKFLDELKTTDLGRPIKDMDFECGIFCEELRK